MSREGTKEQMLSNQQSQVQSKKSLNNFSNLGTTPQQQMDKSFTN